MANAFVNTPNWFSFENQGANLAVADLSNTGQNDLVVLMVDNPPGKNQGFYRVGKKLNATDQIAGGWGNWIAIPDWFSFENQGAGVAIADLPHNGKLDLVVLMVDSPPTTHSFDSGQRLVDVEILSQTGG